MGFNDPYVAYCFDSAVGYLGNYIEAELEKIQGKNAKSTAGRREARLRGLLADGPTKRFRDPAGMLGVHKG